MNYGCVLPGMYIALEGLKGHFCIVTALHMQRMLCIVEGNYRAWVEGDWRENGRTPREVL